MKVLVFGRSGQVAQALAGATAPDNCEVIVVGRPDVDVLAAGSIDAAIAATMPDVIVNAAAYTAVDRAESEEAAAFALNAGAVETIGRKARRAGIPIIHLSTDYVFDGTRDGPYREDDAAAPLGVYGRSKLEGEQRLAEVQPQHIVLRTSWVYAPTGQNFVRTMLRLAETKPALHVVDDQRGSPTYAPHLAEAILTIAGRVAAGGAAWGIYNATGSGSTSWHGFADAIFAEAGRYNWPVPEIVPIRTAEFPTTAKRPANSRLDGSKIRDAFGVSLPDWREGVAECVLAIARAAGRAPDAGGTVKVDRP